MKHTSGPWISHSDNNIYPLWDEDGEHAIADTIDELKERSKEETEANARLIAAAPDLLVALKSLVQVTNYLIEHNHTFNEVACAYLEEAREAISRATI